MTGAAAFAGAAVPPVFEALRWTAPGAEYAVLAEQKYTCITYKRSDGLLFTAGEAFFNAPALLGGQAAKAGLSCASCHVNGRDNPHFLLEGLSDTPGSADVSNSFFSAVRGNGKFDPVPIPDLVKPGKVSRDPEAKALEPFIRNLIVEEFSGEEPSPATLTAIATYIRGIRACVHGDEQTIHTLDMQSTMLFDALKARSEMIKRGDTKAANLLIAAARQQLKLINERFPGPRFARDRKHLLAASQELLRISQMANVAEQNAALRIWEQSFIDGPLDRLITKQPQSLDNSGRLAKQFPASGKQP